MKKLAIVMAAALALPSTAHAAAFFNGSFEDADVNPGSTFTTLASGSEDIDGWVVGGSSIDYIGGYWTAGAGSRSIDLSGNGAGSISQTFDTVNGQAYLVDFLISGNPDGPPPVKTLDVFASGAATSSYTHDSTGTGRPAIGWSSRSYYFVATGSSTTLTFATAASTTPYGPAIDGVSVAAIPEPASWALMIGGFAFAGAFMRRRATRSAVAFG